MAEVVSNNVTSTFQETDRISKLTFHGLRKDSTGLLFYNKTALNSSDSVDITVGDGFAYGGLSDLENNKDNSNASINLSQKGVSEGVSGHLNDRGKRNYDQIQFDTNSLTYFMNETGFLVVRYLKNFSFNSQNGATRNWISS
tara:strand:- start:113 stop:538 length:426 start_codon:yes stop_codon:yes gene_type:complete